MAVGPRDYIDQLLVKKYADEKVDNPAIAKMVEPEKMLNAMGDFSDMRSNMLLLNNTLNSVCAALNAKAAAALFEVPLLRMDMGRLMGKYVGESEGNLRKAIALSEAIAPCVLWIDELEKAFAGINNGGGSEVTTRLFGNFLTWMQEKESPVFVVATANNIMNLPPELMRKGRFDEIFFVGLPNRTERRKIFEIHINKRRKNDMQHIDINKLVDLTEGYSGADIEGVVKDAIEDVFASNKDHITTDDIVKMIRNTHSLSEIMKEPLEKMNKEYKERKFKNASK